MPTGGVLIAICHIQDLAFARPSDNLYPSQPKERNTSTALKKAVRTSSVALKFFTIPMRGF